jgi:molybdopterin-guanine dinucleotide biosynthesis protein A
MGRDKSQLIVDGSTLAVRTAALLEAVVEVVIEVGPGTSGLPATLEEPAGEGPLAAISAGHRALRDRGHSGGALVVACDLPLLTEQLLRQDLESADEFLRRGARSLGHLLTQPGLVLLDESAWQGVAREEQFSDVDSVADLQRLGLAELFAELVDPNDRPHEDQPKQ